MSNNLLTIKEAAKILKVSTKTLRRWEKSGTLISIKTSGGHRRYIPEELIEFKKRKKKWHKIENLAQPLPEVEFSNTNPIIFPETPTVEILKEGNELPQSKLWPIITKIAVIPLIAVILVGTLFLGYKMFKNRTFTNKIIENSSGPAVLGASVNFGNIKFTVNVDSSFTKNVDIANDLKLGGNQTIGSGTPTIDMTGGDLYVTDQLEVGTSITTGTVITGTLNSNTINIGGDSITDLTGTGLSNTGGRLTSSLGTSIDSSEITDGTINEVDLNASNTASNTQILSYNSSTGGFTWVADQTGTSWDLGSALEDISGTLDLLHTCSDGEILKWDEASTSWLCSSDAGGSMGVAHIENNDVSLGSAIDTLDFSTDFTLTTSPANEANISIADDILDFNKLADSMTLDASTTINLGANNFTINTSGAGVFSLTNADNLVIAPNALAGTAFTGTLTTANLTGIQTWTLPDATGTVCITNGNCAGVGGVGDVIGPSGATDNAVVRFDLATGKLIQNSGVIINDTNAVSGITDLDIVQTDGLTSSFAGDGSPTADILSISGGTSATNGVDALQLTFGTSNASGNIIDIAPSFAGGITDSLSYNALNIDGFSPANGSGTDLVSGVNVGNLTDPGATISSSAIKVGTGWDYDLSFSDTTPTIAIADTGTLSFSDGTNNLVQIQDNSNSGNIHAGDLTLGLNDANATITTEDTNESLTIQPNGTGSINNTTTTGNQVFTSSAATTGTTSSAFVFTDNSLTTGTGTYFNSNSITQGNLVQIADTGNVLTSGNLLKISSTDTNSSFSGNLVNLDWAPGSPTTATGNMLSLTAGANANTTGSLLNLSSVSTNFSSGRLATFDWSPGSAVTASGDLFRINIGANGTTSGNLFNVTDAGTSLFRVAENGIESSIPQSFTATGDVTIANDIFLSNQSSSSIKTNAPFTLEVGENSENNDLTLKTYGTGDVVFNNDGSTTAVLTDEGRLALGKTSPTGMLDVDTTNVTTFNKAAVIINHDEQQDLLAASSSGTMVAKIGYTGALTIDPLTTGTYLDFVLDTQWTSGTLINADFGAATTQGAAAITGLNLDLNTNLTAPAAGQNVTGVSVKLPTASTTSNATSYNGFNLSSAGAITNGTAGSFTWNGANLTMPNITQSSGGTVTSNGTLITTGSITTAGTENGINITASGVGAGTLNGISISNVTGSSGTETGIKVGTGWDIGINTASGIAIGSQTVLTPDSTTPSVAGGSHFITANTTGTLISNFTNGTNGQIIAIEVNDVNTDYDCTSSNLNCGTTDITNIETGDTIYFIYDGTNWNLISWVDDDANYSVTGGADLAEMYVGPSDLTPGDVVAIDPENNIKIKKATTTDAQRVIGIISTKPGSILDDGYGKGLSVYPVALSGKVPVKVSNFSDNIIQGDLLGASSSFGLGQKVSNGFIIGRALEPWTKESGKDSVMVFVNSIYVNQEVPSLISYVFDTMKVGVAEIKKVISDKLITKNIAITNDKGETTATVESNGNITTQGDITANKVVADEVISPSITPRDEIEKLLTDVQGWKESIASQSATPTDLSLQNLFVTGAAAFDNISLSKSIVIGNDLVISSNTSSNQTVINSIDTLNSPLSMQSSASQPLYLMAGKIEVDTSGNMTVHADLAVQGNLKVLGSTSLNTLEAQNLSVKDDPAATSSSEINPVTDSLSYIYTTTSSAGSAKIPTGATEITIKNTALTEKSLMFITPTSKSDSPVYIKSQSQGTALIGFDNPSSVDVTFNWWIVGISNQ